MQEDKIWRQKSRDPLRSNSISAMRVENWSRFSVSYGFRIDGLVTLYADVAAVPPSELTAAFVLAFEARGIRSEQQHDLLEYFVAPGETALPMRGKIVGPLPLRPLPSVPSNCSSR